MSDHQLIAGLVLAFVFFFIPGFVLGMWIVKKGWVK